MNNAQPSNNAMNTPQGGVQVQVTCTKKHYEFTHGTAAFENRITNVSTLNGLYPPLVDKDQGDSKPHSGGKQSDTKNALSSSKVQIARGELTDNQRNALSRAIATVPDVLERHFNVKDITSTRENFHRKVQQVKSKLDDVARKSGGIIPVSAMKSAEATMLQYNCTGYNLQIRCDRYTQHKAKGSKLDKRSGLYKITRVVRSYFINKMLTVEQLQRLANDLAKQALADEVVSMEVVSGYRQNRNPKTGSITFQPVTKRKYVTSSGPRRSRPV